jgi:hypothetical protein
MPLVIVASALDAVELTADDADPFSVLERQLRDSEEQRGQEEQRAREEQRILAEQHMHAEMLARQDDERDQRLLADLEDWLSAIVTDRDHRPSA